MSDKTDTTKSTEAAAANERMAENLAAFKPAEKLLKPLLDVEAKAANAPTVRPVEEAMRMSAAAVVHSDGTKGLVLKMCGRECDLIYELGSDAQILAMLTSVLTMYRKVRPGNVHY